MFIRLLAVADLAVRGVTIPRLYSLERLTENGYPVTVKIRNRYPSDLDIDWADVILFLRAASSEDLQFLQRCKAKNKKIWVDSDDDVLHIPLDHNNFYLSQNEPAINSYKEIHKLADLVSYSTKELEEVQTGLHRRSVIIPCAYPDEIVHKFCTPKEHNRLILWRGTDTHAKSLSVFENAIVEAGARHPEWKFVFVGHRPWQIIEKLRNPHQHYPFVDVEGLAQLIADMRPAVHMVPRFDNSFTRCRSSISYVEAAFGGAITVCPNWTEWQLPGVIHYKDVEDFGGAMDKALGMTQEGRTMYSSLAQGFVRKERTWSAINSLQNAALMSVMVGG